MVAVPFLSPPAAAFDLPPEEKARLRARWAAWWEPLREQVRAAPPIEDSDQERAVLIQFVSGVGQTFAEFGSVILPALRSAFDRCLQDLVTAEDSVATTERRLGMKFLSRAVQVLDTFFETFRASSAQTDVLSKVPTSPDEVANSLDPASVALLRLEIAVFVAFDLTQDASPTEFVAWARRALDASNHAAPYLSVLFKGSGLPRATPKSDPLSADVSLPPAAFDRVLDLIESPPTPSTRLRGLIRGRSS